MVPEGKLSTMMGRFGVRLLESRRCLLGKQKGAFGWGWEVNQEMRTLDAYFPENSCPIVWYYTFRIASNLMCSAPGVLGLLRLVFKFGLRKYSHSLWSNDSI